MNICVYGAASSKIDQSYIDETEKLGREIAARKFSLLYGAGASGLMGACARGVTAGNGPVIGVVPHFMHVWEPIYEGCTGTIKTETMGERKQVMEDNADAFIIVPGGIGTFDELFQILTLTELGRKNAPIVLYNINGYYDNIIELIDTDIQKGFIRPVVRELFAVCDTPDAALDYIEAELKKKPAEE